jgi:hypothetical protein
LNEKAQEAQRLVDYFLAQYEAETDDLSKAVLLQKAVYWSMEVDIELATEQVTKDYCERNGFVYESEHAQENPVRKMVATWSTDIVN